MLENDKDIEFVQSCVDELNELHIRSLLPNDLQIRENKKSDAIVSKMEERLSKRIGITFKFYGTNYGAHCIVTPTPESNIINPNSRETYRYLKNILEDYKLTPENQIDKVKHQNNTEAIFKSLHKSMLSIEETLIGKNMKVDYNNMKISGLSKDVVVFVGIPFKTYLKFGETPREIMSILLHEIGHAFNMISTMHQMATSVVTTAEALVDNKPNEKEVVNLAENVYNRKFDSANDLFYKLFQGDIAYEDNGYRLKNNEASADQFATRLGYGEELATGLAKLYNLDIEDDEKKPDFVDKYFKLLRFTLFAYITAIFTIIIAGFALSILLAFAPIMLLLAAFKGILAVIDATSKMELFKDPQKLMQGGALLEPHNYIGSYDKNSPYDDLKQRFRRIKMDIIRQLRTYDVSSKTVDKYLQQLSTIDNLMINVEQDRGFFTLVKHTLLLESNDVGTAKFFMNIEEMTENDFHARDREFKKLLKRK
jgi:hypothetical protein